MFKYLVLLTSVGIAAVAAFFSVSGLAKLFAGSFLAVAIMASALEIGKLVTASLLTRSWDRLTVPLKTYYSIATFVLIVITSAGIYGFLTAAYQTTADELRVLDRQVQILESQKERYQEQLDQSDSQLQSLNTTITQLTEGLANNQIQYVDQETGQLVTSTSRFNREAIQEQLNVSNQERQELNTRRQEWNDSITSKDLQIIDLQSNSEVTSEVGPLRYLSGLTGVSMDRVVNFFALLIVFVFDPLAVTLVVAYNRLQIQDKKEDDDDDGDDGGQMKPTVWVSPDPDGSSTTTSSEWANVTTNFEDLTEQQIKEGLDRVVENILQNQVDLDPQEKGVLYDNLWDLYQTGSEEEPVTEHSVWNDEPVSVKDTLVEGEPFEPDWSDYDEELMDTALEMVQEEEEKLAKEGEDVLDSKESQTQAVPDHWSALSRNKRL